MRAALPTHLHPIGIEGAQLLALAVALAARGTPFDRKAFNEELIARCKEEEFRWQLGVASKLRRKQTFSFLGNSLEAHRSVVSAIACFTVSPDSFEDTIARAIGMGNDTNTLAAMAGAMIGAHLGSVCNSFAADRAVGGAGQRRGIPPRARCEAVSAVWRVDGFRVYNPNTPAVE